MLLEHVVVLGEEHLRRLLREYIAHYDAERVHTSIGDAPDDRLLKDSFSFEYHQGALRTVAAFLGAELEKNRETFAP